MTCWIWQNLVHVMACCLRSTEHRAVCAHLQTTLELSLRIHCGIWPDFTGNAKYNHWNVAEIKWPSFCRRHFQMHFLQLKGLHFYQYFAELYSHGSKVLEKKIVKICCRQIHDSLEQMLWNVHAICIHFSHCCIFRCSFGCYSKGFIIKSQGCWYAL